jgi:hypothetical protein
LGNILKSKKIGIPSTKADWSFNKTEKVYLSARIKLQSEKTDRKAKVDSTDHDLKKFLESRQPNPSTTLECPSKLTIKPLDPDEKV